MILPLVTLVLFGLLLSWAASVVVKAATAIAQRFGVTSYTVGFILLGILTSMPEFFVALQSVQAGVPQLSVGNLLGGSILLFSLLLGGSSILFKRIALHEGRGLRETLLTAAVVASPVLVLWDGELTRVDGVFLLGLYMLHGLLLDTTQKTHPRLVQGKRSLAIPWHVGQLVVGCVFMAGAAHMVVSSTQSLATLFGVPDFFLGLFLVSFGTNLPEMVLVFTAGTHRGRTVAFADVLGSAAANTLFLGLLGIFVPFAIATPGQLRFCLLILGATVAFFVWALSSQRDITRREGIGLLFFYILFILYEFFGVGKLGP